MNEFMQIDKLNNSNYASWLDDIKVVLMEKNLWRITEESEVSPDEALFPKEYNEFQVRKNKAYATIYLSIEKEYRILISEVDDSPQAWKILQKHFRPDSRARVISLTDEFFSCKISEDEDIGLFAARLKKIIIDLKDAGKPIADWYQAFQLIRYLPADYQGMIQIIYRWSDEKFKFINVLNELIAEEARLKQSKSDLEVVALHSANRNSTKKKLESKVKRFSNSEQISLSKAHCNYKNKKPNRARNLNVESSFITEACFNETNGNRNSWVFDTAASSHFCGNKNLFHEFQPLTNNTNMSVAIDGVNCKIEGIGTVKLLFKKGEEIVNLKNVMYSPKLRRNLMAGPLFDKGGASFIGGKGKIDVFSNDGRKLFSARKENGLYYVYPSYPQKRRSNPIALNASNKNNLEDWHRKFCHINPRYIINTSKNESVKGLPIFKNEQLNCEVCKLAKSKRKSFKPIGKIKSTKPLQLLHMDVCGPLPSQSLRGHRYFLSITDDYSRKVIVYPMKNKSEVFDCFTKFQKRAERYLNSKIINIRTDRGMEFCHNEFQNFLDNQGIRAERTNEYTPEQNGVSERFNYTALDAVKCLLKDNNLRNGFWAEALLCFTYTWNRICHQSHNKTPFELYCGRKPSIRHLKPFGATAYIGTPRQLRTKLQMRAKKGVMVGYAMQTKGYRIWLPAERKIIETINVTFDNGFNSGKALDPNDSKFHISTESNSDLESEIPITGEILEDVKVKSEFSGDPNTEEFEPDSKSNLLKRVTWSRQAVPRKDGSRTDIYYRIEGTNTRFRSHNDVKTYCELNGIEYNEGMFNFSGKDPYSGDVKYNEENSNTNI
ncbi:Retrovirus-related Pol polyprotein from transposon TNT 1-94 [Araneus ventricosus]|uniref:Retrovirus-related Pol polyprotein from transposon TNT 1-94 n=1 Tax=Araneus ventricosus TaxID=182803 RepID=A0A4Y2L188_ARAVE|nr:Retrovirus-related Pol polyprotein from transposon TNT 1-94 [Araneus ventricosus]